MRSIYKNRSNRSTGGRSEKGFTLVELLVVVAIMGTLAIVAIPIFSTWIENASYKEVAWGVSSVLNDGREAAITQNLEYRTELDVVGKRYRLTRGNLPAGSTAWTTVKPWEEVSAVAGWATGAGCAGGSVNITFSPDGSSDGGTVCVKDGGGTTRYRVVVSSTSGRVQIE